ncbi:MAG: CDP-glycerol glycerophosphotransferase family protein, partial [Clostridia bacterium]|nr:CDP-glycerol glycerophosphotransferase family protein [Clostridia bacterium]
MKESGVVAFAKHTVLRVISVLFRKDRIVFESNPEFSCNTYPVYRYLIDEKHIDEKYEIVWLVKDKEKYADCGLKNHVFLEYSKVDDSLKKKVEYLWTLATARALIYSNRLLGKYSKSQYSICLMHGMPLKRTQDIYRIDDLCDNVVCMSDFFEDNLADGFGISKKKLLPMDFPRNDLLFTEKNVPAILQYDRYEKVFVWLPTYRKNKYQQQYDIDENATGLPLLKTEGELERVNDWLRKKHCLLIVKPHPIHAKQL